MTAFILINVFLAVVLAVCGLGMLLRHRDPAARRRVRELVLDAGAPGARPGNSLTRSIEPTGLRKLVVDLGGRVPVSSENLGDLRRRLAGAGFRDSSGPLFYMGLRLLLGVLLPLALLITVVPAMTASRAMLVLVSSAALGYVLPAFALARLIRQRQLRIVDALPDTLDLMVVCVEAGLGLNQALMRVGQEMGAVEPVVTEELSLVNLEMRAGTPRAEALKNLARRTGVQDIGSLVAMLVQTDKFGTSIAKSLRVFSDSLRTRRRQKAEETAAKTTVKLVFPLALCIMPALLVVVLGPAALHIFETLLQN